MGDVLTLIEKATAAIDERKVAESMEKLRKNQFTLDDMLAQFEEVKKMGSLKDILSMMPGSGSKKIDTNQVDEKAVDRNVAIIRSMTRKERLYPNLLNASRRKRIAAGSGTTVQDVNRLMRQFEDAQKMMKQLGSMSRFKGEMPALAVAFLLDGPLASRRTIA